MSCRPGIFIGLRRGGAAFSSLRLASVTASSVARTESPSATIRAASSSCASGPPSSASSARACPADSTPAATLRCTGMGNRSSRIMLEMTGRERPIRLASSSWVTSNSSSSC